MKKTIYIISIIAVIMAGVAIFWACEKDEQIEGQISEIVNSKEGMPPGWGIHRHLDKQNNTCIEPPESCFDEIVIKPKEVGDLNTVFSEGEESISNFFANGLYKEYFAGLDNSENAQYLEKLQKNLYSAQIVTDEESTFYLLQNKEDVADQYQFQVIVK